MPKLMSRHCYYAVGHADDIVILIKSKFPSTVLELLQTALGLIQQWYDRTDLTINPSKMVVILFFFIKKIALKGLTLKKNYTAVHKCQPWINVRQGIEVGCTSG
jgi:hypothetical protein